LQVNFADAISDCLFGVWRGGFSLPREKVAVLVCFAKDGYHSLSKYQWHLNDEILMNEAHPVLYASCCGVFKCAVEVKGAGGMKDHFVEYLFTIQGKLDRKYSPVRTSVLIAREPSKYPPHSGSSA
jgi:hypothetical protein